MNAGVDGAQTGATTLWSAAATAAGLLMLLAGGWVKFAPRTAGAHRR